MVKTVVLCCTSRSGSTYLGELLESVGIGRCAEYFNPGENAKPHWHRELNVPWEARIEDYAEALIAHRSQGGFFVTKLLRKLASELIPHVLEPDHYIFLRRRDTLRQAISLYRAEFTGRWGWLPCQPKPPPAPFNRERILKLVDTIAKSNDGWLRFFEERGIVPIEAYYEDCDVAPEVEIDRIAGELGATPSGTPAATKQRMSDELTERFLQQLSQ